MAIGLTLLAIAATVLVGARLSVRTGVPAPLLLILIGIIGSFLPFIPEITLSPEIVLFGVLPPLLYAAAIQTSLIDFARNRAVIASLSVGLVLFTAFGVALVSWWLLPVPFAVAFALGAIVAPPDAVAATAVGRQIGLPRRLVSILEGESLVNDATALVSLRTAIAAAGLGSALAVHEVSAASIALDFLRALLGGIAVGIAVAVIVEMVRQRTSNPTFDTVLSFMVPFAAYLPAEALDASGVIAVVTAGLILGHRSPRSQPGASRLSERINWTSIQFLLENAVFLLIGLQVAHDIDRVAASPLGAGRIAVAAVAVLLAVLLLRPLWLVLYRLVVHRVGRPAPWSYTIVLSWAGMRGVVTLAAALLLPTSTPHRDVLILIAVLVTVGTLLLQGTTLPRLARRLGVRGPDPREDALQTATVMQSAAEAGLRVLKGRTDLDEATQRLLRSRSEDRVNRLWERLGRRGEDVRETPSDAYRRARLDMLEAERAELLRLRDTGHVDHEILRDVLGTLDIEEAMLERVNERAETLREEDLLPPEQVAGACVHLAETPSIQTPRTPEGCEECLQDATSWVHLRLCLECGHVGCCDSSPRRHATAHFHETRHPVMRSFEPGEAWRWCFVDDVIG